MNIDLRGFLKKLISRTGCRPDRATAGQIKEIAACCDSIQSQGMPPHLQRIRLKGKLGYGIFLKPGSKPIRKGEIIAPYSGEVYIAPQNIGNGSDYAFALLSDFKLTKEEQKRWDPKRKFRPNRTYSLDLDAEKQGNFTRFINHSSEPNIIAEFLQIPSNSYGLEKGSLHIVYMAAKTIRPGEQLLVCYEGEDKSYWGAMGIKPFPMNPRTFLLKNQIAPSQSSRGHRDRQRKRWFLSACHP